MDAWLTSAMSNIALWFQEIQDEFVLNFIAKGRWKMLLTGTKNTLTITLFALLIGVAIGTLIAVVRTLWSSNKHTMRPGLPKTLLCIFNRIAIWYTTIIRGTPVVVQLMILYYIVFASSSNGLLIATLSFGINSGAYVAEIIRGGILSIEKGQMEAGRSLGLNYGQTMIHVIAPQVLKTVLPTLANEFIALMKETSVAGYVAVMDLTFAGDRIRGATYSPFMPLLAVALIYLLLVMLLSHLVGKLERRMRQSDLR